jgi:hypothetical protein
MSTARFPVPNSQIGASSHRRELVARYKRLRAAMVKLNTVLMKWVTSDMYDEGAARLGLLDGKYMVLDSASDLAALADYCIHTLRRNGRTVVEQFLVDSPPADDSEEMAILRAMQNGTYAVLLVQSTESGVGFAARDLLTDEDRFVVDIGLGSTGTPGLAIATRLFELGGLTMTGGAAVLLGTVSTEAQKAALVERVKAAPRIAGELDPAGMFALSNALAGSSRILYAAPGRMPAKLMSPTTNRHAQRKCRRDELCPCGSGKKYKNCCGR